MSMFTDHLHEEIDELLAENKRLRAAIGVMNHAIDAMVLVSKVDPWLFDWFQRDMNELGFYKQTQPIVLNNKKEEK